MIEKIKKQISNSILVKEAMIEYCTDDINSAASLMIDSIRNGGKYFGVEMVVVQQMHST